MSNKQFSERLHQELDKMDVPKHYDERVEAFAKLVKVPRFQAETILNGQIPTDDDLINRIALELEVDRDWLFGKDTSHSS